MNLAYKCYTERIDMIDTVLNNTKQLFASAEITIVEHRTPVGRELEKLLKIPVDSYNDILTVLSLEHFIPLLNCYDYSGRKEMSAYLVNNVINNATLIPSPEKVETILTMVAPLVSDQTDGPTGDQSKSEDREEWEEEQGLMGRMVHLLQADTADQQYLVLTAARKHFSAGGPLRLPHTLPPLVFQAYQLARKFFSVKEEDDKWDPKVEKIFKFCHSTVSALVKAELAELPLRLFLQVRMNKVKIVQSILQGALACNAIPFANHETVAYEYMSQVLLTQFNPQDCDYYVAGLLPLRGRDLRQSSTACSDQPDYRNFPADELLLRGEPRPPPLPVCSCSRQTAQET